MSAITMELRRNRLMLSYLIVAVLLVLLAVAGGFLSDRFLTWRNIGNLFQQHLVHKTVLSLLSWVIFGTLLFGRRRWGWRGTRAVRWTLVAMALLLLAFFGSQFVLELVLRRA